MTTDDSENREITLESVLCLLDRWRHLPSYQLERRADVIFALFLPEVLKKQFCTGNLCLVPEFPIKKSRLQSYHDDTTAQSINVDFLAVEERARDDKGTSRRAFLVELKTDMASWNEAQERHLRQAVKVGLKELVLDVIDICFATNQKSKYIHLLHLLSELKIPVKYDDALYPVERGYSETLREVQTRVSKTRPADWPSLELVYVQPKNNIIDFNEFATIIRENGAEGIRQTFARYLEEWAAKDAGERDPKCSGPC